MTNPAIVFKDALHSAVLELICPNDRPYPRVPSRITEVGPDGRTTRSYTPSVVTAIKRDTFTLQGVRDNGDQVMAFARASDANAEGVTYIMEYRVGGSAVSIILDHAYKLESRLNRAAQEEAKGE